MKIDFIIGRLSKGGAERVMATLSNYFVKMGHVVRIITFDDSNDGYELDDKIERIRINGKKFRIKKLNNLVGLSSFYKTTHRRPDVAISFLTFTNLISILGCKFRKIPVIVSEHNNHTFILKPKWLVKFTWNYLYRRAKFVTVLTDFDVSFFMEKKAKVVVMPNPCSFPSIKSNSHTREKTILAVGSLNRIHHKGFDNLIEIMSSVLPEFPEWKLRIVGGGEKSNQRILEQLIQEKELEDRVSLDGYCDNITELMQKDSIYILSSRFEGLPMVLLEAMSQGMACISYNCITGPSNMITDKVNGILVADQDIEEMKKSLALLMTDGKKRHDLGSQAIKSLDNYNIDYIYKQWENLLMQIED